jgi:hypothetical protein
MCSSLCALILHILLLHATAAWGVTRLPQHLRKCFCLHTANPPSSQSMSSNIKLRPVFFRSANLCTLDGRCGRLLASMAHPSLAHHLLLPFECETVSGMENAVTRPWSRKAAVDTTGATPMRIFQRFCPISPVASPTLPPHQGNRSSSAADLSTTTPHTG